MDQGRAPLFEALQRHARKGYTGFHFPGHSGGRGFTRAFRTLAGQSARYDLTELPGLDDLHAPTGPIKRAEALAARLYGAGKTFFLVNGSTAGVQAMMAAVLREGDGIILPRNIHRSVVAGLVLTGAEPVFINPPVDPVFGVCLGIKPGDLADTIRRHPGVRAFLPVHPNYYGAAGLSAAHAQIVREAQITLLVDEAHGAHLPFHPALPRPAMELGAAAAVQSMHKMGTGLTQTALLHLRDPGVDPAAVRRALGMLQTSSPSYLLMASIDLARRQMALQGDRLVGRMVELADELRRGLEKADLRVMNAPEGQDPAKLLVSLRGTGISGLEVLRVLGRSFRIQVELADQNNLLLVVGPGSRRNDIRRLQAALKEMLRKRTSREEHAAFIQPPAAPLVLTPRRAFQAPAVTVELAQAGGRVAAETVTVSPPGIPALIIGEKVSREMIEYILEVRSRGQLLTAHDPTGQTLRVVAER